MVTVSKVQLGVAMCLNLVALSVMWWSRDCPVRNAHAYYPHHAPHTDSPTSQETPAKPVPETSPPAATPAPVGAADDKYDPKKWVSGLEVDPAKCNAKDLAGCWGDLVPPARTTTVDDMEVHVFLNKPYGDYCITIGSFVNAGFTNLRCLGWKDDRVNPANFVWTRLPLAIEYLDEVIKKDPYMVVGLLDGGDISNIGTKAEVLERFVMLEKKYGKSMVYSAEANCFVLGGCDDTNIFPTARGRMPFLNVGVLTARAYVAAWFFRGLLKWHEVAQKMPVPNDQQLVGYVLATYPEINKHVAMDFDSDLTFSFFDAWAPWTVCHYGDKNESERGWSSWKTGGKPLFGHTNGPKDVSMLAYFMSKSHWVYTEDLQFERDDMKDLWKLCSKHWKTFHTMPIPSYMTVRVRPPELVNIPPKCSEEPGTLRVNQLFMIVTADGREWKVDAGKRSLAYASRCGSETPDGMRLVFRKTDGGDGVVTEFDEFYITNANNTRRLEMGEGYSHRLRLTHSHRPSSYFVAQKILPEGEKPPPEGTPIRYNEPMKLAAADGFCLNIDNMHKPSYVNESGDLIKYRMYVRT